MLLSVGNVNPHRQGGQQGKEMCQEWQLNPLPIACHSRWQAREFQWEKQRFLAYGLPLCILVKIKNMFLRFLWQRVEGFQLAVGQEYLTHMIFYKGSYMSAHPGI